MDGTGGAGVEMVWMRVVPVHAHAEAGPFGYAVVAAAGGGLHPAVATARADGPSRPARRAARESARRAAIERAAARVAAVLAGRAGTVRVALVVDRSRLEADAEEGVAVEALRGAGLDAVASGLGASEPERVRERVAGFDVDAVRELLWRGECAGEDAALGSLPGGSAADPYGYETDGDAIQPHDEDSDLLIEDRYAIGAGPDPLASAVVGDLPPSVPARGPAPAADEDLGEMLDHLVMVCGRRLAARARGGGDPYQAPLAHLARRCRSALARGGASGRPPEAWEAAMAEALAEAADREGVDDRAETPMSALMAALGEPRGAGTRLGIEPRPAVPSPPLLPLPLAVPEGRGCFGEWLRFRGFLEAIRESASLYALDPARAESAACAVEVVRKLAWRALADCPPRESLGALAEALVDDALDHRGIERSGVRKRITLGRRLMAALAHEGRERGALVESIFGEAPVAP